MLVTTAQSASKILTASNRPPSPTSSIAISTSARLNNCTAASVPNSKYVRETPQFVLAASTASKALHNSSIARFPLGYSHTLVITKQVGRSVATGTISCAAQDGLHHCAR